MTANVREVGFSVAVALAAEVVSFQAANALIQFGAVRVVPGQRGVSFHPAQQSD